MNKTRTALAITTLGLGLAGCGVLDALLKLSDLSLLGVTPAAGFADVGGSDAGKATIAVGAEDKGGLPIIPPLSLLEVEDEDGNPVDIEEGEEVPGHLAGSMVLLVDGSGSMENTSPDCADCPTDPSRHRVQAAKELSKKLQACGPDWRQSLMEFTTEASDPQLSSTRVLADFGAEPDEVGAAADGLSSYGGTPIWDSTYEVIGLLAGDASEAFAASEAGELDSASPGVDEWGTGLVVISDGTDTSSVTSLDQLIQRANEAGIAVHTIGLGPASDSVEEYGTEPAAIEDLRRLAKETGGYYGFVSSPDELPGLAESIAKASCGGYQELTVRFAEPKASGERVNGKLKLANTDLAVPFTFTAP
jgi:hypothetical protein